MKTKTYPIYSFGGWILLIILSGCLTVYAVCYNTTPVRCKRDGDTCYGYSPNCPNQIGGAIYGGTIIDAWIFSDTGYYDHPRTTPIEPNCTYTCNFIDCMGVHFSVPDSTWVGVPDTGSARPGCGRGG